MEKVSKKALMDMKAGDMRVFSAPDLESVRSARVLTCIYSNSKNKRPDVSRFETRTDSDKIIVRAVGNE